MADTTSVTEIEHYWVPMPDGVRLSARLWLPEERPAPVIVEYIPYRKRDMVRARDERNHPWFAARGYACVRVDMRGSGDSEGSMADMYDDAELDDALAVLEWINQQDWCDGAIGMMGTSWGGTSALQAAASGSGLLKAVIAVCATNDRYNDDIHHMGGCLLTDSIEWGATLPAIHALPPSADSDPNGWRDNWNKRLEQLEFPLFKWIEHETRDAYWRHGSVAETPASFDCPVLAIGGWADRYSNTVMNVIEDNPENCWGIVGPWGHHFPDQGVPGPAIGFQQEALRWWDHWLRKKDNGVDEDPTLRVWCHEFQLPRDFHSMRNGHWLAVSDWATAVKTQSYQDYILELQHGTDNAKNSRCLDRIPADLKVGSAAGDTGYFGRPGGLPDNQLIDDSRSLVFQTGALESKQILLGKAKVELVLRTDQLPAQVIVRLNDVSPDGEVMRVAYRVHNLGLDENYRPAGQVSNDGALRLELELPNAAHVFAVGHRIRIALSTSYWPMIWPVATKPEISIGSQTLRLQLAEVPDRSQRLAQSNFSESQTLVNRDPDRIRESIQRNYDFEADTGTLVYSWRQPLAMTAHQSVGLQIGSETIAEHRICIDDPLTANSRFEHCLVLKDGNRHFESKGIAEVRAESDCFIVVGSVQVFENQETIFSRDWSQKITRRYG